MKINLKRMLCGMLMLVLVTLPGFALMEGAREKCYSVMDMLLTLELGEAVAKDMPAEEFGDMLGMLIAEGSDTTPAQLMAVGPNASGETVGSVWQLNTTPAETLLLTVKLLGYWDLMSGGLEDGAFAIHYLSDRLDEGILSINSKETAQMFIDVADGSVSSGQEKAASGPVLPSMLSYADYRLAETPGSWDNGLPYLSYTGFASDDAMDGFVRDYIKLLTSEYGYRQTKREDVKNLGTYIVYYLEHDDPSLRPIAHRNFSGDVVIEMFCGYGSTCYLSMSQNLEAGYVETDDRTGVRFQ